MQIKLRNRILTGVLAVLMLLGTPLTVSAEAPASVTSASAADDLAASLDFSRADATHAVSQDVSVLLAAAQGSWTGSAPAQEEYAYLRDEELTLRYDEAVSADHISTTVENGALTVTVQAVAYTAQNGETVRWIPTAATLGGESKTLAENAERTAWETTFAGPDESVLHTLEVTWRAELSLTAETVDGLINRAWRDASAMLSAQAQYEKDFAAYETAMAKYRADMQTYEQKNTAYQEYTKKKAAYDAELKAYREYLDKVAAYEAVVAAYAAYQQAQTAYQTAFAAYQAQLSGMQAQQQAYQNYQNNLAQRAQVLAKLAVVESLFRTDSEGRSMKKTLMGDTVASVVARRSELVAAGASAADVDTANTSTSLLQALLINYEYAAARGDDARYQWYRDNYQSLKTGFVSLYGALNSLYGNTMVRTVLQMQGKLERYCQFVSQLYVISTALDDLTSFDPNWKIQTGSKTWAAPKDLLESVHLLTDTNAYAPNVPLPAAVPAVEKPVLPAAPTAPTPVAAPVKTWTKELTPPGEAPKSVAKPTKPELSSYTVGEPTKPVATAALQAVMTLVEAEKLGERTRAAAPLTFSVETSLSRSVNLSSKPAVTFYNYNGSILHAVQVTAGSPVFYEGEAPARPADAQYTYTFRGWTTADGKEADLSAITADTELHAAFDTVLNRYTVTWVIGDRRAEQEYAYGEIPSYNEMETVFADETYEYTFIGWATALRQVTGDATYVALFRVRSLTESAYAVTFTVGERQVWRTYSFGEIPSFDDFEKEYIDENRRYTFIGWDKEFETVKGDTQYTAQFDSQWLVPAGEMGSEGAAVQETSQELTVTTDEMVADLRWAIGYAKEKGLTLSLKMADARVTLDDEALAALSDAVFFRLAPVAAEEGMSYLFTAADASGKKLTPNCELLLELPLDRKLASLTKLGAYLDGAVLDASREGGVLYLSPTAFGTVRVLPAYRLTVQTEGNGTVLIDGAPTESLAGETLTLQTYCEQGWELASLEAVTAEGRAVAMTGDSFVMPMDDVTVRAVFRLSEYTVVFMSEGRELSRGNYHFGDTVELPADPEWTGETAEGERVTFSGWSPTVSAVSENVTYVAQFTTAKLNDYNSGNNSNKLVTVALPIVGGAAAVGITFGILWRVKGPAWFKGLFERLKELFCKTKK
ncbi:MAG: hypothetical protein IJW99_02650 [Clostridia bacterium]|nr:hypothetical protein [Clostridia bacterium]